MLSIDFIKKNKEKVIRAAKAKNRPVNVEKIIKLDEKKRALMKNSQKLREERNKLAKKKPNRQSIQQGKRLREKIKDLEQELKKIEFELERLLSYIPNLPLEEVPLGKDSSDNIEIKRWGEIPSFDFKPLSHIELGKTLDLLDLKRGVKVSGFRGYFLKNQLAQIHLALLTYVFNKLINKGYTPIIAPAIVKRFTLFGSGQFPWGKQDVYQLNDKDAYLAGTAEVPVTAYFANETLEEKDLPKKFVALSPCFRKEAGAYGKDTKGLYRLHEFWKVEQVIIGKNSLKEGLKLHQELEKNAEEILEELQLPYRVVLMCTGEMGEPQLKKYDIETWMPSRNEYGETMSNSIMGEFQARRLRITYRDNQGKKNYCFTLNNTALASPRILIAIMENYQQKDGSILVPKVLQKLVGFEKITRKKNPSPK